MARAFRWEGDAAVAHLDDLEIEALREGASAVITVLGGIPGVDLAASVPSVGAVPDGPPPQEWSEQEDIDARFAELTAGLGPTEPLHDEGERSPWGGSRDSALARLLPPAHREDVELAESFAAVAHDSVRRAKIANLNTLVAACEQAEETGVMVLDAAPARRVMAALTDIRLVLADRLGIVEEGDSERVETETRWFIDRVERGDRLDEDEQVRLNLGIHHGFMGWLQETLVEAVLLR